MRGYGVLDFMVRTYRNNRALLKERKPLKKIYEENNLLYIERRAKKRAGTFDPEKRKVFLDKFYSRQKRIKKRLTLLLFLIILTFGVMSYWIFELINRIN